MSEGITITVPNVDVDLLREQRDALLEMRLTRESDEWLAVTGVIHLLDAMLDVAEGEREEVECPRCHRIDTGAYAKTHIADHGYCHECLSDWKYGEQSE